MLHRRLRIQPLEMGNKSLVGTRRSTASNAAGQGAHRLPLPTELRLSPRSHILLDVCLLDSACETCSRYSFRSGLEVVNSQGLLVTGRTSSLHTIIRLRLLLAFSALNENSGATFISPGPGSVSQTTHSRAAARSRRCAPVRLAFR